MNSNQIAKLVSLARHYDSFNCRTRKELSQETYRRRESGESIPYVPVEYHRDCYATPQPTKRQKDWEFIDDWHSGDAHLKHPEGITIMYIGEYEGEPQPIETIHIMVVTRKHDSEKNETDIIRYNNKYDLMNVAWRTDMGSFLKETVIEQQELELEA